MDVVVVVTASFEAVELDEPEEFSLPPTFPAGPFVDDVVVVVGVASLAGLGAPGLPPSLPLKPP